MLKLVASLLCLLFSLSLAACAFGVDVARAPHAPVLPPSDAADIVHARPSGGTELATINLQGNNWQSASDCEARLILEARKVGANVVFAQPEESGIGKGPRCRGIAYAVQR